MRILSPLSGFSGLAVGALVCAGCAVKTARAPLPGASPEGFAAGDESYTDVRNGWRLRVLIPLVKGGGFTVSTACAANAAGVMECSAPGLIGYQVSYYLASGDGDGRVRLRLVSAETTVDGKTTPEPKPLPLPFRLPRESRYIRLVHLIRASAADHDMAIVTARRAGEIGPFTALPREKPEACAAREEMSCVWVPQGVSVRPESPEEVRTTAGR